MAKDTLANLLAQKAALDKQIATYQREQRGEAIGQIRSLMAQYGLSLADIGSKTATAAPVKVKKVPSKVAAKYRNAATGDTWSGRGLKPKWLTAALAGGASMADFAI